MQKRFEPFHLVINCVKKKNTRKNHILFYVYSNELPWKCHQQDVKEKQELCTSASVHLTQQ